MKLGVKYSDSKLIANAESDHYKFNPFTIQEALTSKMPKQIRWFFK